MSSTPDTRRSRRGTGVSKREAKKALRKKQAEEQDPALERQRMLEVSRHLASQCSGTVVSCDRGQNGYGIIFRAVPPTQSGENGGVYVNSVSSASPSYSQRAQLVSKRVAAINGVDARTLTGQQLQSAVAQAVPPLLLVVTYDPDILEHFISTAYLNFDCALPGTHPGGFGLQVGPKPHDGIDVELGTMFMVTAKSSDTAAALATSIRVGDTVVKINNYHLEGMMLSQVIDAMNSNADKMEIKLRRRRQVVTFLIPRGARGFGFRLAIVKGSRRASDTSTTSDASMTTTGVLVSDVTPTNAADIAGLYVGYEVVRINGVSASGMTTADLVRCIAAAEHHIELCTQPNTALLAAYTTERAATLALNPPHASQADETPSDVCVQRDANGSLGVSMGVVEATSNTSGGLVVTAVTPGGPAWRSGGQIRPGARVVALNGTPTDGLSMTDVVVLLSTTPTSDVTFALAAGGPLLDAYKAATRTAPRQRVLPGSCTSLSQSDASQRTVTLSREFSTQSFGMVLSGPENSSDVALGRRGVFLCGTQPDTPAAHAITADHVGCHVIEINSVGIRDATLADVLDMLSTDLEGVLDLHLVLADNPTLTETYTDAASWILTCECELADPVIDLELQGPTSAAERGGDVVVMTSNNYPQAIGSKVVKVNGVSTVSLIVDEVWDLIKQHSTTSQVDLELVRRPHSPRVAATREDSNTTTTPTPSTPQLPLSSSAPVLGERTSGAPGTTAPDTAERVRVVLHRSGTVSSFGLRFQGAQNEHDCDAFGSGIFISGVRPGTPAATCPDLRIEWQVARIGDHDLRAATISDLRSALSDLGDTLVLELVRNDALVQRYKKVSDSAPGRRRQALRGSIYRRRPETQHVVHCTLQKRSSDTKGFGVRLNGAKNAHIADEHGFGVFVSGVAPGSPAEAASELQIGWQIVAVNGVDTLHTTIADIAPLLRDTGDTVLLALAENPELRRTYDALRAQARSSTHEKPLAVHTVQLGKQDGSFGVKFGGPRNVADAEKYMYGVYISGVRENSPAATNADVRVGWQIVAMNGTDTSKATFVQLKGLLAECGDVLELSLQPNEALRDTFDAIKDSRNHMRSSVRVKAPEVLVTLQKGDNGFGINFGGARNDKHAAEVMPGVFIAGIKANTPAESHPDVLEGLQIVGMNGTDLERGTFVDVKGVLATMTDHMDLRLRENAALVAAHMVDPPTEGTPAPAGATGATTHDTTTNGTGAETSGTDGADATVTASATNGTGVQGVAVGETGDATASVDAADDGSATDAASAETLVATGEDGTGGGDSNGAGTVSLTLVLDGTSKGFGISFGGARNAKHAAAVGVEGVYILDTKSGGVGARHPDMKVGWQIVSLNGADLTSATHQDMRGTLRAVGNEMVLTLRENEPLRIAHETWKREANGRKQQTTANVPSAESTTDDGDVATSSASLHRLSLNGTDGADGESSSDADTRVSLGLTSAGESSSDTQPIMSLGTSSGGESSSDITAASQDPEAMAKLWAINKTTACVRATLQKGSTGFGLKFGGAKDREEADEYGYGMYIASVKPGTPAESNKNVKIGWQIVSVDGQDTSNATLIEMKEVLRNLGDTMTIEQIQNTHLAASYHEKKEAERKAMQESEPVADASATDGTVTCTIAKTKEGFGLSFQGPKNDKEGAEHGYGVYISDVKEGFPAAQQANVNKGWQIVTMNGVDVRGGTFKDLKPILAPLDAVGAEMTLVLRENARLRATYDTLRAASRRK